MNDLNVRTEKIKQWLDDGAPAEALEQLGELVKSFSTNAAEEEIAYKDAESPTDPEETEEVEAVKSSEEGISNDEDASGGSEVSEDPLAEGGEELTSTEGMDESASEDASKSVASQSLETVLVKTVDAALTTYHDTVVKPLLDKIEELEINILNTTKGKTVSNLFDMDDFLPAAAVTALVKERYGVSETIDGDTVSDEEIETANQDLESEAKSVSNDSTNLLSGLI